MQGVSNSGGAGGETLMQGYTKGHRAGAQSSTEKCNVNCAFKKCLPINSLSATVRRLASLRNEVRGEGWGEVSGIRMEGAGLGSKLTVNSVGRLRRYCVQASIQTSRIVCKCQLRHPIAIGCGNAENYKFRWSWWRNLNARVHKVAQSRGTE